MRRAEVYLFDRLAGYIEEREPRGYRFWYDAAYVKDPQAVPLSHSRELPILQLSALFWYNTHIFNQKQRGELSDSSLA